MANGPNIFQMLLVYIVFSSNLQILIIHYQDAAFLQQLLL